MVAIATTMTMAMAVAISLITRTTIVRGQKDHTLLILHRHRPQTTIKLVLQEGSPAVHIFINIVYGRSCVFLAWQALLVTMVKKLR